MLAAPSECISRPANLPCAVYLKKKDQGKIWILIASDHYRVIPHRQAAFCQVKQQRTLMINQGHMLHIYSVHSLILSKSRIQSQSPRSSCSFLTIKIVPSSFLFHLIFFVIYLSGINIETTSMSVVVDFRVSIEGLSSLLRRPAQLDSQLVDGSNQTMGGGSNVAGYGPPHTSAWSKIQLRAL
jgi:hypothetical protein